MSDQGLHELLESCGFHEGSAFHHALIEICDGPKWPTTTIATTMGTFAKAMGKQPANDEAEMRKTFHLIRSYMSKLNARISSEWTLKPRFTRPLYFVTFSATQAEQQCILLVFDPSLAPLLLATKAETEKRRDVPKYQSRRSEVRQLIESYYDCPEHQLLQLGTTNSRGIAHIPFGSGAFKRRIPLDTLVRLIIADRSAEPVPERSRHRTQAPLSSKDKDTENQQSDASDIEGGGHRLVGARRADTDNVDPAPWTLGLWGLAGIGKTTLAREIEADDKVQTTFQNRVLSLTLGKIAGPERIKRNVTKVDNWLIQTITKSTKEIAVIERAKKESLWNRSKSFPFLLILDDVHTPDQVEAFRQLGEHCCILATSKSRRTLESIVGLRTCILNLAPLNHDQSLALFDACTGLVPGRLRDECMPLVKYCAGIPLALKIAGRMVWKSLGRMERPTGFLKSGKLHLFRAFVDDYTETDPAAEANETLLSNILVACIQTFLTTKEQLYLRKLAIAPAQTRIPYQALETFWNLSSRDEIDNLVDTFVGLALIELQTETGAIWLHDLVHGYLRQDEDQMRKLHEELIISYAHVCSPNSLSRINKRQRIDWSSLTPDGYCFEHLPYHLVHAGWHEQVNRLLLDFCWLSAKLSFTHVYALLADYRLMPYPDDDIETVREAIRTSAYAIVTDKSQFCGQLYGRLLPYKNSRVKKLRESICAVAKKPWLRALTPSLSSVKLGLVQVASLPLGSNSWSAVSQDGMRATARMPDGSLVFWNVLENAECFRIRENKVRLVFVAGTSQHYFVCLVRSMPRFDEIEVLDLDSGITWSCPEPIRKRASNVSLTPDGQKILVVSNDGALKVWSVGSNRPLHNLPSDAGGSRTAILCPDGCSVIISDPGVFYKLDLRTSTRSSFIVSDFPPLFADNVAISGDKTRVACSVHNESVCVFDVQTGELNCRIENPQRYYITCIALAFDGSRVAFGLADQTAFICDAATGVLSSVLPRHPEKVVCLAFSSDGNNVLSYDALGVARLWDLTKLSARRPETTHHLEVVAITINEASGEVYSSGADRVLKSWALSSGRNLDSVYAGEYSSFSVGMRRGTGAVFMGVRPKRSIAAWSPPCADVENVIDDIGMKELRALSADPGIRRIVLSRGTDLECWDLESKACRFSNPVQDGQVSAVDVSSDAMYAAVALDTGRLLLWNLDSNAVEREISLDPQSPVKAVQFSASGDRVMASTGSDIFEWDLGQEVRRDIVAPLPGLVDVSALTPDGAYVVENCHAHFNVFGLSSQRALLRGDNCGYVKAAFISHDGATVVSVSDCGDLILWSVREGKQIADLFASGTSAAMLVSPVNQVVFDRVEFFVDFFDIEHSELPKTLGPLRRPPTLFRSGIGDEVCVLSGWPEPLYLVDVAEGGRPMDISGGLKHRFAYCIALGKQKLAVGTNLGICIFDRTTQKQTKQIAYERYAVASLEFTDDETQLLAGYVDGEVALWDAVSETKLWSRKHHKNDVTVLAIAALKDVFLSGGQDCVVRVAELGTGKELAALYLDDTVTCAAITKDASMVVVGTSSGVVHFFHTENL